MKHDCGCVTEKKSGIILVKPCKIHGQNQKWVWVALQHKEGKRN
jgi:hypothetical protein